MKMNRKIVKKYRLGDKAEIKNDLAFWLSKTPEERLSAVEYLRRQFHGNTQRLQRVARITNRTQVDAEALGEQ